MFGKSKLFSGRVSTGFKAMLSVALMLVATPVRADYTRTCFAEYQFGPQGGVYSTRAFSVMATRAGPNRARRAARAYIDTCISDHWQIRMTDIRPRSCSLGGFRDYPFTSLHDEITAIACAANPGKVFLDLGVFVTFSGHKGCLRDNNDWNRSLASNYRVICPGVTLPSGTASQAVPAFPDTRLPGADFRMFRPEAEDWRLCARACNDDSQCRAWTYRAPTESRGPVCLLKNRMTVRVPDACCQSGVKR